MSRQLAGAARPWAMLGLATGGFPVNERVRRVRRAGPVRVPALPAMAPPGAARSARQGLA